MNDGTDLIAALAPVAAVLDQLGVRFYVGGSVASSFHGAARSTMDVDLVCELVAENVPAFVCAFGDDFYVSELAVRTGAIPNCVCKNRELCLGMRGLVSAFSFAGHLLGVPLPCAELITAFV